MNSWYQFYGISAMFVIFSGRKESLPRTAWVSRIPSVQGESLQGWSPLDFGSHFFHTPYNTNILIQAISLPCLIIWITSLLGEVVYYGFTIVSISSMLLLFDLNVGKCSTSDFHHIDFVSVTILGLRLMTDSWSVVEYWKSRTLVNSIRSRSFLSPVWKISNYSYKKYTKRSCHGYEPCETWSVWVCFLETARTRART